MENQHRKINGYRELTQGEIDLINEIKAEAENLSRLYDKVNELIDNQYFSLNEEVSRRVEIAEPGRWLEIARTDLQTGIMALTRAVAQPTGGW